MRTHTCGELTREDLGKEVTLSGWVRFSRDHGGVLFFDLADSHGCTQLVYDPEALDGDVDQGSLVSVLEGFGRESVITIHGLVRDRVEGTEDPRNHTGQVEVLINSARLLNRSRPIPFEIAEQKHSMLPGEDTRLRFRFLDLRREDMVRNLRFRAELVSAARRFL